MSATCRTQRSISGSTTRVVSALGIVGGIVGLTLAGPVGAAAATESGTPQVVNQETVQVTLDPSGDLDVARLYSQLTVLGTGTVAVQDPTSAKNLRDLDGFSTPSVVDGKAQYSITVDGREDRRTVADYTGELPVTLKASYRLDGEQVDPDDVVGRSGTLETTYTVVNRTAEPTEISYLDGKGQQITETVGLVTPYVGRLQVALPSQFRNVRAEGSDGGGDGRGGTALSWTLVLFDPIGEPAQRLIWTADVEDAELPPTQLQVVPVDAGGNRVLDTSMTTIGAGATAASALTAGAFKIDGKVLEVRDGARKIFDGLVQLEEGANALNAGLADSAAPGSRQLADGLGQAKAGGDKLAGGLDQLADGNEALAQGLRSTSGQDDLSGGAAKIAGGLVSVRDGVAKLVASDGLPRATAGLKELLFGLDHPAGALGATDPGGLLQGLTAIAGGLSHPVGATGPADRGGVKEGLTALLSTDPTAPGLPLALAGVTASKIELDAKLAAGGPLAQLKAGSSALATHVPTALGVLAGACATAQALQGGTIADPSLAAGCAGYTAPTTVGQLTGAAAGVDAGVQSVIDSTTASRAGLVGLETGLTNAVNGLTAMQLGVNQLAAGSASARDAVKNRVVPGVQLLITGLTGAVSGISGQLAPGVDQLATGSGTLATKLGEAADGARKLADGSSTAATGSDDLTSGLEKLLVGGTKLADGLGDAADGSGKIADGVTAVKDGVGQLADGSNRLSGEGTSLLATSANVAASDNAKKAAMLAAMAEKGKDGALPYGAPEGAVGDAAFSYVLAGANSDARDNTTRGAAAIALLALGSLSGFAIRRRLTA